jgi:hypothetical protein
MAFLQVLEELVLMWEFLRLALWFEQAGKIESWAVCLLMPPPVAF